MKGFQIQQKGERRISAALRIMLVVVLLAVQIGFVVAKIGRASCRERV